MGLRGNRSLAERLDALLTLPGILGILRLARAFTRASFRTTVVESLANRGDCAFSRAFSQKSKKPAKHGGLSQILKNYFTAATRALRRDL